MAFLADDYAPAVMSAASELDWAAVEDTVTSLVELRNREGRLFILGLGGSAGNASHMTNDFRKLAAIETYAPTDNVSELTARINDDGWGNALAGWLRASRLSSRDAVFVLSVGGGDIARGVSIELISALDYAKSVGATIYAIVGRDGGYTATVADHAIIIPNVAPAMVTPLAEAFQAVVWHGLVSHPRLAAAPAHWEMLETR